MEHADAVNMQIMEKFEGARPSRGNLSSFLVRDGFLKSTAEVAIKSFENTLDFLDEIRLELGDDGKTDEAEGGTPLPRGSNDPSASAAESGATHPAEDSSVSHNDEGIRTEVFAIDEGNVTITWPSELSADSFEDVSDWMTIILRKMERAVVSR